MMDAVSVQSLRDQLSEINAEIGPDEWNASPLLLIRREEIAAQIRRGGAR